jgi:hypothetical protein
MSFYTNDKGENVEIEKMESGRLIHAIAKYAEQAGKENQVVKDLKAEAIKRLYDKEESTCSECTAKIQKSLGGVN